MRMSRRGTIGFTVAGLLLAGTTAQIGANAKPPGVVSAGTITVSPSTAVAGGGTKYVLRYQTKGGVSPQYLFYRITNDFTLSPNGGRGARKVLGLKGEFRRLGTTTPVL